MKGKHITARTITSIVFCSSILYCQFHSDDGPSYQLFFINDYRNVIFFLTGDINIKNKSLQLEYEPRSSDNTRVNVIIGEVIGHFKEIKVLDSLEIVPEQLKYREKSKIKEFNVRNLRKGIKLIVWINDVIPERTNFIHLDKLTILERAKAIYLEQQRLAIFGIDKGEKALLIEAARNCEE